MLRSNSNKSLSFLKLFGTVPQNRLELRWNNARSVKSPSSSGKNPAISPWLRSMPATVMLEELSGAGAQNTAVYLQTLDPTQLPVMLWGSERMACFRAWRAM